MPIISGLITNDGAIIEVMIGLTPSQTALRRSHGQPIPSPLLLRAQIDNGASQTCIDLQCVLTLGLLSTATRAMVTPTKSGASQTLDAYDVSVTLVHSATNLFLPQVEVVGASMFLQGFDVLLGRDVLKHCLFVQDGPAGVFSLAF
jgi:hypothetical protein